MVPYHHKLIILLSSVFLLPVIFSCSPKEDELLRRTQFIMGTLVEITVREPDREKARLAMSSAFNEMRRLENLMSTHLPDSEISRLNANAGEKASLAVSPEVQGHGAGSALVRAGLGECLSLGWQAVFLLGNPAYYSRFGFSLAAPQGFRYESENFDHAFQLIELVPNALSGCSGWVRYHEAFSEL